MKKILKKRNIIISVALLLIIGVVGSILLNPLRRPNEEIKKDLLKLTPIGTSRGDVIKITEKKSKWKNRYINGDVRINIGTYYTPFPVDVIAVWYFDEYDKLIDVKIKKYKDSF